MFVGFKMDLKLSEIYDYVDFGSQQLKASLEDIHESLEKYLLGKNSLSADEIMRDWFPPIKANVFISHSHNDLNLAQGLAGFLQRKLGLKSFIDSAVWGYANDLLRLIDDEYCVEKQNNGYTTYNYNQRNFSTSHVHIMLNSALMRMIDQTECIIFLNTPNTIVFRDPSSKTYTDSPWIYSELLMTQVLRRKELIEYRKHIIQESKGLYHKEGLSILYSVPTENLYDLQFSDLESLCQVHGSPYKKLDALYENLEVIDKDGRTRQKQGDIF